MVPKKTSYVTVSLSGSPPVQLRFVVTETSVEPFWGLGLLGVFGAAITHSIEKTLTNDDTIIIITIAILIFFRMILYDLPKIFW